MSRLFVVALALFGVTFAQTWQRATDGFFTVQTATAEDARHLPEVFAILQQARRDLRKVAKMATLEAVTVMVYPDLEAFTAATAAPWFVAALADRDAATLHTQRLRVLLERQSLTKTLRHELFHLAQPTDWPCWQAEGEAMRFAGETPQATPLPDLSDAELDAILAAPPSPELLQRAVATAYARVRYPRD